MISVDYNATHGEIAQATFDLLISRPSMRFVLSIMNFACFMLCAGFALMLYTHSATPREFATVIMALIWLMFYKKINRFVIGRVIGKRGLHGFAQNFNIDKNKIFCRINNNPTNLEWKKIKFILKNNDGYIVPLSGLTNAGKFLWLPKRGFTGANSEQNFIALVQQLKKKIKLVK